MNTVIVFTLKDIIGITVIVIILAWVASLYFIDWKNDPDRWWNRRK